MKTVLTTVVKAFSLILLCVRGDNEVTLTTAIARDDYVSVKPTTLYRRIDVDRNVEEKPRNTLNIFRSRESKRRSRSEIWNWDYWCQLQPKMGNCSKRGTNEREKRIDVDRNVEEKPRNTLNIFRSRESKRRSRSEIWNWDYWCQLQPKMGNCSKRGTNERENFYYDAQLDQCVKFSYSGCNGNKNRFDTIVDCERHCKGAVFIRTPNVPWSASCSLQPNAGLCIALLYRYYYDVNEETCKRFLFGGCGGNENSFETKYKCLKQCVQKKDSLEDVM